MKQKLDPLRHYLSELKLGPVAESSRIEDLLAECWDELDMPRDGGMQANKLNGRTEDVNWNPPLLTFQIERHGGTVQGSSRAELQQWTIDVVNGTARVDQMSFRQICSVAPRMDVKPIAKEIADLIVRGQEDERIRWLDGGRVRVEIGTVIPEGIAARQTIQGRRKRFRNELNKLLSCLGWVPNLGANTYVREN